MHADRCGNTHRQKCRTKESGKEVKIQEFSNTDTTNVKLEMYDHTNYNWSHWNSNESLMKNLEAIPGKHSIDSPQKTAILGKLHIIRKVLQCETLSLSGGGHHWFKRTTKKKRPVTIGNNNNNNNLYLFSSTSIHFPIILIVFSTTGNLDFCLQFSKVTVNNTTFQQPNLFVQIRESCVI
jgi:hypothetical protein